jgi:hypothetical protein
MPPHGNWGDSEDGRSGSDREPLEFVHHDYGPAARGQVVECPPYGRPDYKCPFRVAGLDRCVIEVEFVVLADCFPAPLVSSNVDHHADEPGLFMSRLTWNGFG